ncbi:hypothetical protein AX16_009367 [Volvariella volvacea WC 439]|nr:hypothetical protein AX16_009367 [Volvariella volvacea WC 439]
MSAQPEPLPQKVIRPTLYSAVSHQALILLGRPDSVPGGPDSTAPSGPPIGAIVGGVVGGVLLIVGAAIIAFIMIRRRRARKQKEAQAYPQPPMSYNGTYVDSGHGRTFSDGSGKIPGVNDFGGYARLDTMSPTSAGGYTTSPFTTTHGHSSSMTSFSVISGPGSAVPMSPMPVSPPPLPSPAATGSSPTGGRSHGHTVGSSVGTIAELNIQPFMLPHATNMTTQFPPDSKVRPVGYDSPTSPPNGATAIPMDVAPATGPARRLNPPPYSPALNQQEGEVVTATPMRAEKSGPSSSSQTLATGRSARTHRGNQASVDTHHSRSSSRQIPGARVVGGGSVAGGSTTSGTSASAANSVVNDAATNIGEGETSYGGAGHLPGAAGVLSPVTVTSGRARDTIATGMSGVLVNQQHMGLPQVTNPDLDATPPTPSPMNHRGVDI